MIYTLMPNWIWHNPTGAQNILKLHLNLSFYIIRRYIKLLLYLIYSSKVISILRNADLLLYWNHGSVGETVVVTFLLWSCLYIKSIISSYIYTYWSIFFSNLFQAMPQIHSIESLTQINILKKILDKSSINLDGSRVWNNLKGDIKLDSHMQWNPRYMDSKWYVS